MPNVISYVTSTTFEKGCKKNPVFLTWQLSKNWQ